ncbi:DUF5597 domain-containing protein [Microbacterium yannicii]|uniref:DUF5597 domain-containing protein n=1 Tax=Microbacterium yannicii TaxID=671622 RepID=A0ABP9M450_9MICO|nr:DUF5597 domain-containing protein [Microbacterium yannicii]MCO5954439.1 DUF5597 domain-containing protein [Microbacterium yannicii]
MNDPHRRFVDGRFVLRGRPYLIVGGELHNSGSSTPRAIEQSLDVAAEIGVNTVLAPVAWELIEPQEGVFDFHTVDALIEGARTRGLHIVPLWFGTWKNGMSTYVPGWVKQDPERFPRIRNASGESIEAISPFCRAARDADALAFAALMRHLAAHDDGETVLMVQVENEVGVLGDSRDRSPLAEERWGDAVPAAVREAVGRSRPGRLRSTMQRSGGGENADWQTLFGDEADEAFMASAYASYIDAVARAGREAFDVPLYVNAWVDANLESDGGDSEFALGGGTSPGVYPSGGPLRHTSSIWRALAPTLDFLAPDLYFGSFDLIAGEYAAIDGILFIPEMQCNRVGVEQMFRAVGQLGASGVAPFAFDLMTKDDPHYADVKDAFALLSAIGRVVEQHPGAELTGFTLTDTDPTRRLFPDGALEVTRSHMAEIFPTPRNGVGVVARLDDDAYVIVGRGFAVRALRADGARAGWLSVEELEHEDDQWVVRRRLNGDEIGGGEWIRLPAIEQVQSELFPIRQSTVSSGALRVRTYSY